MEVTNRVLLSSGLQTFDVSHESDNQKSIYEFLFVTKIQIVFSR